MLNEKLKIEWIDDDVIQSISAAILEMRGEGGA